MIRTVSIVFIDNKKLSFEEISKLKNYYFLCTNDSLRIGDIIYDCRYHNLMQVVEFINNSCVYYRGCTLKTLEVSFKLGDTCEYRVPSCSINTSSNIAANTLKNPNTKHYLSISIDEARDWYLSGNDTLKELALKMFTKEEIEDSYEFINCMVRTRSIVKVTVAQLSNFVYLSKLSQIAEYYNEGWVKTLDNDGYFIGEFNYNNHINYVDVIDHNIGIFKHSYVKYPGIVYFKTPELARRAYDLLNK